MLRLLGIITTATADNNNVHDLTIVMDDVTLLAKYQGQNGLVSKDNFVRVEKADGETASVSIFVFFIQTVGLICKEQSFFGAADYFNLDMESSAGT